MTTTNPAMDLPSREYRLRARIDQLNDENERLADELAAERARRHDMEDRLARLADKIARTPPPVTKRTRRTSRCPRCGGPKMPSSLICASCNGRDKMRALVEKRAA